MWLPDTMNDKYRKVEITEAINMRFGEKLPEDPYIIGVTEDGMGVYYKYFQDQVVIFPKEMIDFYIFLRNNSFYGNTCPLVVLDNDDYWTCLYKHFKVKARSIKIPEGILDITGNRVPRTTTTYNSKTLKLTTLPSLMFERYFMKAIDRTFKDYRDPRLNCIGLPWIVDSTGNHDNLYTSYLHDFVMFSADKDFHNYMYEEKMRLHIYRYQQYYIPVFRYIFNQQYMCVYSEPLVQVAEYYSASEMNWMRQNIQEEENKKNWNR
jgi:hypothetical protein